MTPKQRDLIADLHMKICRMDIYYHLLQRKMNELSESIDNTVIMDKHEFTVDEINRLISFNQRLTELELYLYDLGYKESTQLAARVSDPDDPLDDYEIETTLYFILGEDDPDFDEDEDNFLTQRHISLKRIDREYGLGDEVDHREPYRNFPEGLKEVRNCWLFYDLYTNSRGLEQPSITLRDCLRVDSIWADVAVHHQATLDIKTGKWIQPTGVQK
ncbi:MAG: hypothetical protein ABL933_02810 [Methyloglobulus sp.]|nr:hypothetical protein [Methyloglobulus sp.]